MVQTLKKNDLTEHWCGERVIYVTNTTFLISHQYCAILRYVFYL